MGAAAGQSSIAISDAQAARIRESLPEIVQSAPFRTTRQCQVLLTWIVERTLAGENDLLKERVIGSEVFDRSADYDPGVDPIVRVRAADVRKRLAQYYQNCAEGFVQIEIPPGSYRAVFHWKPDPASTLPVNTRAGPLQRWAWIAVAVLLAAAGVVAMASRAQGRKIHASPATALDQFWAPAFASPKPILIYNSSPTVFRPPDLTDSTKHLVKVTGQYMCIGDAYAGAMFSGLLSQRAKLFQMRYGADVSFGDLRYQPSILIGAFTNTWTLQTTKDLRFVFEKHPTIRDRSDNKLYTLPSLGPDGHTSEDYAIVSRVFDSKTGELLIAAAGITQYGTRAAGEFLTAATGMAAFERRAPPGWQKKNLQVLLHTQVVGETPGPPAIVTVHVW